VYNQGDKGRFPPYLQMLVSNTFCGAACVEVSSMRDSDRRGCLPLSLALMTGYTKPTKPTRRTLEYCIVTDDDLDKSYAHDDAGAESNTEKCYGG